MAARLFERITVIGLGLIGSSIARAIHERGLATTIVAYDRNEVSLAYGRKHGFVDIAELKLKDAVANSDVIIIATPPNTLEDIAKKIASALKPGAIVMDVCSVKQPAVESIEPHLPKNVYFLPAHPIAGSEHSGVAAGRADLFEHKRVIITPSDPSVIEPIFQQVDTFWKSMGAKVEAMPAHLHDLVYAYVSHLPQLLAFAAGSVLDIPPETESADDLLRIFLRLSHSNTDMWTEIFLLNKDNIVTALNRYLDAIDHIKTELCEAPDDAPIPESDTVLARTALFPRVVASCLITTVMEAEKKAGFSFARYAGPGFADFTYPASQSPEGDIESIANQYVAVVEVLEEFTARLKALSLAISTGNEDYL